MAKVKITKTPKPLYQQDPKTFALDASPVFGKSAVDANNYRRQYPEADPEDATIEAEKGETILTPQLEHFTIGGKKHEQGGTPLDPEMGSFIFSNDKKLRIKGDALSEFGKNPEADSSKKGFTPAELAKNYQTNKFLAILRDKEATPLDKDTASLVLGNMKGKLGKLAFMQESMKGFPDGIPDISQSKDDNDDDQQPKMKRGGKVKMQAGGVTDMAKKLARLTRDVPKDYKLMGTEGLRDYYMKQGQPGSPGTGKPGSPEFNKAFAQARTQGLKNFSFNGKLYNTNLGTPGKPGVPDDYLYTSHPGETIGLGIHTPQTTFNGPVVAPSGPDITSRPNTNPKTFQNPSYDTGYGTLDYANMAAPWLIPIKKYNPIRTHVNPQQLQFNPLDLEAQRQSIKGQASQAQAANNALGSSASESSVRNSQLLGQILDPLNQSFMTEFNANQAGRSQIEGENAQFRQQANLYNAQADDQYNARTATVNQNFDDEKRLRLQQYMKAWNNAESSRQVRNAGNTLNEDYMVTANGQILRKPTSFDPDRQFQRITGESSGGNSQGLSFDQYKQSLPQDVMQDMKPAELWRAFQQASGATYQAKDANGVMVRTRNPYLVPQPYEYSTLPYNQ